MIGLDTNVLARFFTQDDARQATKANRVIDQCSGDNPGFIGLIVLSELFWLLEKTYKYTRAQQLDLLSNLLEVEDLVVEFSDDVRQAVKLFAESKKVQLADCLIAIRNTKAGCVTTKTFDKSAAKISGFELIR